MKSYEELEQYFEKLPIAFVLMKVENNQNISFSYVNTAFTKLERLEKQAAINSSIYGLFPEETKEMIVICKKAAYNQEQTKLHRFCPQLGKYLGFIFYPWEEGYCACLLWDETELIQNQKELNYRNTHDPLTGLYNRISYMNYSHEFANKRLEATGVVFLNINGLKHLNDVYGLVFGDRMILQITEQMKQIFSNSKIFRVSGDEFIIIKENCDRALFMNLAKRLKEALHTEEGQSAACGYIWAEHPTGIYTLAEKAEELMYLDKNAYYENQNGYYNHKPKLLNTLLDNIKNHCYSVYLQPKVDIKTNKICGAEALARLIGKDGIIVSPESFIPALEKDKIISYLDFYIFTEVCKLLTEWIKRGIEIVISVNFSRITLIDPEFVENLEKIRLKYAVPAHLLAIEITETREMLSKERMIDLLYKLKKIGYFLELDDFGKQYSSMEMLTYDMLDVVKLDRTFVMEIDKSEKISRLVSYICAFCHEMNMKCLAEGIETIKQLDTMKSLGCDYVQGFYYGCPVPTDQFEGLYKQKEEK